MLEERRRFQTVLLLGCASKAERANLEIRASLRLEFLVRWRKVATVIPRYTRPEMGRIWSDENRFRTWLTVEVAATETLAEAGMVPKEAARAIRERSDFSLQRIHE